MTEYGTGSVYQRARDGRWVAAIDLPRLKGEPRRRKILTGHSREQVEERLATYRAFHPATPYLGRSAFMEQAKAQGTHTTDEWMALVRDTAGVCEYCGAQTTFDTLTQDHCTPVSRGGSDAIANIAVSCRICNTEKGTLTADEYASWKQGRRGA